jgi:hypothetical protein
MGLCFVVEFKIITTKTTTQPALIQTSWNLMLKIRTKSYTESMLLKKSKQQNYLLHVVI